MGLAILPAQHPNMRDYSFPPPTAIDNFLVPRTGCNSTLLAGQGMKLMFVHDWNHRGNVYALHPVGVGVCPLQPGTALATSRWIMASQPVDIARLDIAGARVQHAQTAPRAVFPLAFSHKL